jgi:hypothetical protein
LLFSGDTLKISCRYRPLRRRRVASEALKFGLADFEINIA